ncbi:hypothetical protein [Curtobacterium sp. MCSS17_016]|uniref:hypothetical protein n=1 Tax=Curtobacterium sp. MCSS17_016 TaxID=2175644 RepID=UPI000DA75BFA|nr:hypothetical protein [Curtobacterium sp. MCSS17_016]WIE81068.1 hypothetical protein DEJ19_021360 [Curtobacterium sp. MCSS17_016]
MSHFPEHDKIDAHRYSNPLATNLAHMLLNGRGWVLENKLTDPPVRLPVARLAAALLGVDAEAYRRELDARFGIPTVPSSIVEVVTDWSMESAVLEELRAIDDEVSARITKVISDAAAESPIAAAVAAGYPHLVADGTLLAAPDPDVRPEHRGTLLGAAVSLGLITNDAASAHPAAGVPLTEEDIFGKPEVPAAPAPSPVLDLPAVAPAPEPVFPVAAPDATWTPDAAALPDPTWPSASTAEQVTLPSLPDLSQPAPALDVLDLPAFESGNDFALPAPAPAPALAQTDWNVPAFGPTQFDDLGVTPPDTDFQFGSYNLDQDGAGEDFNQPLLAPTAYDVDAPVEGVAEAVSDAELEARRDEALSYLNETAGATAETSEDSAPAEEPLPFPTPDTSAVFLPAPAFDVPLAAPAFEDVVAGTAPVDEAASTVEHKSFDLLNVPDGRFPTA